MCFNETGELVNFISDDRYNADAGIKMTWSTPLRDYKNINGFKIAGNAEAVYKYPEKELIYGIFEVSCVKYNCK
ncbi:MAG: hypothetical protein IPM38_14330 [Ignavibacteria bacterium]|nr:hypothetical protein [Ignavibacteria bacterium]